jgi:hypothetical protein
MNLHFTEKDWARIERDWGLFWEGCLNRPLVGMELCDPRTKPVPEFKRYFQQYPDALCAEDILAIETRQMERMRFIGDAFPKRFINFGPGSLASYMGSRVGVAEDTIWFYPLGKPLRDIQISVDRQGFWYQRVHSILDAALQAWGNRVQISLSDIGGNLDTLASLRGTEELLLDMMDDPDTVERLTRDIKREWMTVYLEEAKKIRPVCRGTAPWAAIWSKENSYMFQCDLSYMFSTELFNRLVVPDLEACCEHIPASFYHLDGKGALKHLDSLLAIKKLRGIQWIPGAGQPEAHEWPEVLSKIRKTGKLCQVYESPKGALKMKETMDLTGFIIQLNLPANTTPEEAQRLYETLVK